MVLRIGQAAAKATIIKGRLFVIKALLWEDFMIFSNAVNFECIKGSDERYTVPY